MPEGKHVYLMHAELTIQDFGDGAGNLAYLETDTSEIQDLPPINQITALAYASFALQQVAQHVAVNAFGPKAGPTMVHRACERINEKPPMSIKRENG